MSCLTKEKERVSHRAKGLKHLPLLHSQHGDLPRPSPARIPPPRLTLQFLAVEGYRFRRGPSSASTPQGWSCTGINSGKYARPKTKASVARRPGYPTKHSSRCSSGGQDSRGARFKGRHILVIQKRIDCSGVGWERGKRKERKERGQGTTWAWLVGLQHSVPGMPPRSAAACPFLPIRCARSNPYEGRATRSAPARCPQHNRGKYKFYALKKKGRKRGVERSSSCRYSRWVSKQDECNPHHHSFLHRWLLPHSTFLDLVQQRLGWVAMARPRHGHRKDSFSPLPG